MPISLSEEPETAQLSRKPDRQLTDHLENAADHRPPSNDHLSDDR
jgi:hypothetical protein